MASSKQIIFVFFTLFVFVSYSGGKSIRSRTKVHQINKSTSSPFVLSPTPHVNQINERTSSPFGMEDTCPPPDFLLEFVGKRCTDSCHLDEDCQGRRMCCYNGCKMCMEPVLPPPVIDWLGSSITYNRGFAESVGGYIEVLEPEQFVEEVSCYYKGMTISKGQLFFKGCHRCQCSKEGIDCEVGPCRGVAEPRQEDEQQEQHSGDDQENSGDVDRENRIYARASGEYSELITLEEPASGEGELEPTLARLRHMTPGSPDRREPRRYKQQRRRENSRNVDMFFSRERLP